MYYIRFTSDITADIENGFSTHFNGGTKLAGLCAWPINDSELGLYASDSEIIAAAKITANLIASNTYGGYSSNNSYAVLKGTYVGSSNDGVCIKIDEIIAVKSL